MDALGSVYRYQYDPTFHDVTSGADPLGHVTTFTYDAFGNLTTTTDVGNVTTETWSNGLLVGNRSAGSYNDLCLQRQSAAHHADGSPRAHDKLHLRRGRRRADVTDPLGRVTSYTYDAMGGNYPKPIAGPSNRLHADAH